MSRSNGCACASRWCASSTGCAACRCVLPGITASGCAAACVVERVDDVEHTRRHAAHGVTQPHPEQRRHLIVARTPGAQSATEFGADPVDQPALERAVHVLVGFGGRERARSRRRRRACRAPSSIAARSSSREQAGLVQHPRVRLGRADVVRAPAPSRNESTCSAPPWPRPDRTRIGRPRARPRWSPSTHTPRSAGQAIAPTGDLRRQPVDLNESLGGGLVERVALVVGREVEVVQRLACCAGR